MNEDYINDLIEKSLDKTINETEQLELERLCNQNSDVKQRLDEANEISTKINDAETPKFLTGFSARVMRRIQNQKSASYDELLAQFFPKIAVPAFAIVCLVMVSNVLMADPQKELVDALFALPDVGSFSLMLF